MIAITKNSFELLGLTSSATTEEVKLAWQKLASIHHPDKGGDANKFSELRQAYKDAINAAVANDELADQCVQCLGEGKVLNLKQRGFCASFKVMCPICKGSGKIKGV